MSKNFQLGPVSGLLALLKPPLARAVHLFLVALWVLIPCACAATKILTRVKMLVIMLDHAQHLQSYVFKP